MFTFLFPKFHVRDVFGIVAIAAVVLFVQMLRNRKPDASKRAKRWTDVISPVSVVSIVFAALVLWALWDAW
jgi:NADH:ubiquinone oxidoreductase subunit 6 (subunit J)